MHKSGLFASVGGMSCNLNRDWSFRLNLWCGPCKVIAPKYKELSEKYLDVVFLKLDCNQDNKPLAKELGIKVVPTFKILKDNKVVKEVTGAKYDDLVAAIDVVRSS
ncbi:thioredoxin F-type chloroplastic-like [Trifolium pratense]|uniref:Thioredoxin F-type chloroplastic-like n=1 Tax=Trifolium pratense TaxID=57577 RepID=A0A2K3LCH6_TRIPR|nr:thioredoxin F-type chloroplastic-like [Trifolium pratense]